MPDEMKSHERKPDWCPFCVSNNLSTPTDGMMICVRCSDCLAEGPAVAVNVKNSKNKAIGLWNIRTIKGD